MCFFPYLAVCLRDDMRTGHDVLGPVKRIAARHGLRLQPLEPKGALVRFGEDADLVATFSVEHCACDWSSERRGLLAALARDLLAARDVRRVRVGIWSIRSDVARADPASALHIAEIDTDALDAIDWEGDVALDVRRGSTPPFPTRRLRQLAFAPEA